MNKVKISKFISYILRHNPQKFNLQLDEYGFVELDKLLSVVKKYFTNITKETIIEIVEFSYKKRFEIVNDKIRAMYGHSIKVNLSSKETEPPENLFHGTSRNSVKQILQSGLKPMRRQYVHLSTTVKDAYDVGLRKDKNPVILKINAKKAYNNGIKFYKSVDLYLSEWIPKEFIEIEKTF